MIDLSKIENIYLVPGYTDMGRKQVDGLLSIISVNHTELILKKKQSLHFSVVNLELQSKSGHI